MKVLHLQEHFQKTTGKPVGITGRYFAMDRGKNWDRTSIAYKALVQGKAETKVEAKKWDDAIKEKYEKGKQMNLLNL
jgi:2,3-bisphosphoglycerate-independent phosphoglycerate mutase